MKDNSYNNCDEKTLVMKIVEGDINSFSIIVSNTKNLVSSIVSKMIDNIEDREDVIQETYLKCFKGLKNFKFNSKISTWIGKIAYNTSLNFLEKNKIVFFNDLYKEETITENNYYDINDVEELENSLLNESFFSILKSEINLLPPIYKTLIILYHTENLGYNEIAIITSLPVGTIKNYLFRGRKLLKKNFLKTISKNE